MKMKTKTDISIFWFRRDLRLEDNIGLHHALRSDYPVIPIFIFDKKILTKLDNPYDKRVNFIYLALNQLKNELNKIGSDLILYLGSPEEVWAKIVDQYNIKQVYFNEDYEPYAIKRDKKITNFLDKKNIFVSSSKDQCIFAKKDILKKDNSPYTVFTAYKNKWLDTLTPQDIMSVHNKRYFKNFLKLSPTKIINIKELGFQLNKEVKIVKSIKKEFITKYDKTRDIPSLNATTRIGHHLRFGTISPRKCAQLGKSLNQTWLSEIIWREFFMQILFHFPHVVKAPFREKYSKIKWRNNRTEFKKWCEGKTGFPLVDAGIRELNQTGFMHNRVRMVVASFLIKDLLIDWRWGEKYFASKLLDYDLASNNGNWQWVAGTGCDSAPYFRIFNPDTQLKKFDPELKYIKRWIPEYGTNSYPEKMLDHNMAYHRALLAYKTI
jgi:deoxyribodipyrimidine photo-lyase